MVLLSVCNTYSQSVANKNAPFAIVKDDVVYACGSMMLMKHLLSSDSIVPVQGAKIINLEAQVGTLMSEAVLLVDQITILNEIDTALTEMVEVVVNLEDMTMKELRKYKSNEFLKKVGAFFKKSWDKIVIFVVGVATGIVVGVVVVPLI